MEKAKRIFDILIHKKNSWSTVGWICILVLAITSLYFITTDTVEMEGTISCLNEEACIVFHDYIVSHDIELHMPFSLKTEDGTLVEYAKSNHGDRVLCKIKKRYRFGVLYFELLSVDEIRTDNCIVKWY